MKRMTAVLFAAFVLSLPLSAIADEGDSRSELQDHYLRTTEEYQWKASTLEGKWRDLGYRQQWVMAELIDICYRLAETKEAMAQAVKTADRDRQETLETEYYALKREERQLWDELERLTK